MFIKPGALLAASAGPGRVAVSRQVRSGQARSPVEYFTSLRAGLAAGSHRNWRVPLSPRPAYMSLHIRYTSHTRQVPARRYTVQYALPIPERRGPPSHLAVSAIYLGARRRQRRQAAAPRTQLEDLLYAVPETGEVVVNQTWRHGTGRVRYQTHRRG